MKLRNSQIISFLNTYAAIKTKKLPVKLGYAIKKNVSAVTAASEAYSAERNELLEHYAQKGENGQFLVNDGCYVIPDQEGYAKDIEAVSYTHLDVYKRQLYEVGIHQRDMGF